MTRDRKGCPRSILWIPAESEGYQEWRLLLILVSVDVPSEGFREGTLADFYLTAKTDIDFKDEKTYSIRSFNNVNRSQQFHLYTSSNHGREVQHPYSSLALNI